MVNTQKKTSRRLVVLAEHRERVCVEGTNLDMLNMRVPVTSTSGIKGVRFDGKKWRACITLRRHKYHLGGYETSAEAKKARKQAEKEMYAPILEKYGLCLRA
jgi:hypothetical protein